MEDRFLYSVFPKMLIKDLPGVAAFRSQKSLTLTKDEVKHCMKFGSVYRRFANENKTERVTMANIDRLHNSTYMTEEEYEQFLKSNVDSNRGQGTIDIDLATTSTVETETVTEEVTSEVVEEETVAENSEDVATEETVDEVEETVESDVEEASETEEVEEESETEEEPTETTNKKSTYQSKKKKR